MFFVHPPFVFFSKCQNSFSRTFFSSNFAPLVDLFAFSISYFSHQVPHQVCTALLFRIITLRCFNSGLPFRVVMQYFSFAFLPVSCVFASMRYFLPPTFRISNSFFFANCFHILSSATFFSLAPVLIYIFFQKIFMLLFFAPFHSHICYARHFSISHSFIFLTSRNIYLA